MLLSTPRELAAFHSHVVGCVTVRGVVESYVLREGTDYGTVERTLEEKIAAVQGQLEAGTAVILYDPETRSIDLVRREARGRK